MEVFSGSLNGKLLWEAWIGTSSSIVVKTFLQDWLIYRRRRFGFIIYKFLLLKLVLLVSLTHFMPLVSFLCPLLKTS